MKLRTAAWAVMTAAAVSSVSITATAAGLPSNQVAWQRAAADPDIDRAFAQARAANKPVLLYWGATWCPPCNQLKATLFNRQDFAALSRSFVAVHVDGDLPGAQKLGQRFRVTGYPTLVLFTPQAGEITRLPGEADAAQVMQVMQLGLAGGRPAKAVLADALAGGAASANEWRMLAFYSWDTDEQQLVPKSEQAAALARLAAAAPASDAETATRLWLKALAASDDGQGVKPDAALRERVARVLADPTQARPQLDVLTYGAVEIVRTLQPEPGAPRDALLAAFDSALARLAADPQLSRGNRIDALYARLRLARIDQPKDTVAPRIPAPLLAAVREQAARDDREINDGYERQAVVTTAGAALALAGLWTESDALLQANLAKSHSPYYLMSQLAGNARKRGNNAEALRWYGQAFEKSEGPATRLQWGSNYLQALVDLAPADGARIEKTAARLFTEAGRDPGAFEGRSARSLQRAGAKLVAWNADGRRAAPMKRLQAQLDAVCARPSVAAEQRASCRSLLTPAGAKPAA